MTRPISLPIDNFLQAMADEANHAKDWESFCKVANSCIENDFMDFAEKKKMSETILYTKDKRIFYHLFNPDVFLEYIHVQENEADHSYSLVFFDLTKREMLKIESGKHLAPEPINDFVKNRLKYDYDIS